MDRERESGALMKPADGHDDHRRCGARRRGLRRRRGPAAAVVGVFLHDRPDGSSSDRSIPEWGLLPDDGRAGARTRRDRVGVL